MGGSYQAAGHFFPSLIGADVLDRCRYVRNFPASLNLVSHLREDHEVIKEFARSVVWDGEQLVCDRTGLSAGDCLFSRSVSFHWYWCLGAPKVPTHPALPP